MANTNFTLPDGIPPIEQSLLKYIHHLHPELQTRYDLLFEVLYQQLPEKQKADIVDGQIILHQCPAMPPHDQLNHLLYSILHNYAKQFPQSGIVFGPMTLIQIPPISPNDNPTGREPDLFWIKKMDLDLVNGAKFTGIPQLIIEILATDPEERKRDLVSKAEEYARLGVPEYWILDLWEDETKFGTLTESSYSWTTWTDDEDPWIESENIPGFILRKSWMTMMDGELPSVNEIDPYVLGIQEHLEESEHQIDALEHEKDALEHQREEYEAILQEHGLLSKQKFKR